MSLTIEQLDNHLQDQPTVVIIGKNLLLKFTPSKSLLSSNNNLQEIIRIPDLLAADNGILTRVDEIRRLSKDITKITEEVIQIRDVLKPTEHTDKAMAGIIDRMKGYFSGSKNKVLNDS